MNLLSLPDEMLANVFKFSKFETGVLLRKMNVRIDAVTLRYGINKPKIDSFSAYENVVYLTTQTTTFHVDCANVGHPSRQLKMERSNSFRVMECLKKIRDAQKLGFHDREIDDKFLYLLASIKHKNRIYIEFNECSFKVSVESMEKVLSRFRSVRFVIYMKNTILNANFASDKVMCSLLSYAEIFLTRYNYNVFLPAITDKTLLEIQRYLPEYFGLEDICANFTIPEIIRTIKVAVLNRETSKKYWNLGRMHVERKEFSGMIEEFRNIEGITITEKRSIAYITFTHYDQCILTISCN